METPGLAASRTIHETRAAAAGVDGASTVSAVADSAESAKAEKAPQFAEALDAARRSMVTVQRGDTLTRIAQRLMAATQPNSPVTPGQAHMKAMELARANRLENPDRIHPGQLIDTSAITADEKYRTDRAEGLRKPVALPAPVVRVDEASAQNRNFPLLNRTLSRATSMGFIPAQDQYAVQDRILDLAKKHSFSPDDFARTALMESDGFNPRANNGRCYGIIQFCDGPDRGAASAGYGRNPSEIMKLSVLQQLDLVDRYFDDTRLKDFGSNRKPVGLDDLYLTILTPAARQERRLHAALPIAGPQAPALHVQKDTRNPITRNSLLEGLYQNAMHRLGALGDNLRTPPPTRISSAGPLPGPSARF